MSACPPVPKNGQRRPKVRPPRSAFLRPPQLRLDLHDEVIADNFAGGGGASTGIEWALGRSPDVAINHNPEALSMHQANHPETRHLCEDVFAVDPVKATGGRPVGFAWFSPDCFPAGTLVLTRRGYRPIEGIAIGEEVFTHKLRWKKVTRVFNAMRPLVQLKGHGHPGLSVSPEHPFYARLRKDVWRTKPRGYQRTLANPEWVKASAMGKGCYWAAPLHFPAADVPIVGGRGFKDPRLLWLAGMYLGNGWTRLSHTRAELVITCGMQKAAALRQQLHAFAELKWQERKTRTACQFTTAHRGLVEWLRTHFSHLAHSKILPAWLLGADRPDREALLDGYLSADGWTDGSISECNTVSKALAFGIKALLNSLGKTVIVHLEAENNTEIEGRNVNARPLFQLRWRKEPDTAHAQTFRENGIEWCPVRSRKALTGEAEVFNLSVEDDESYVVEGIIVHNCTHFSKAKGGKPRSKKIRGLAWVMVKWAASFKKAGLPTSNIQRPMKPTYTATLSDGTVAYRNRPEGNLWGELPLGAYLVKGDDGSMSRTDGGDPWDGAKVHLPSGRTVIVRRDTETMQHLQADLAEATRQRDELRGALELLRDHRDTTPQERHFIRGILARVDGTPSSICTVTVRRD